MKDRYIFMFLFPTYMYYDIILVHTSQNVLFSSQELLQNRWNYKISIDPNDYTNGYTNTHLRKLVFAIARRLFQDPHSDLTFLQCQSLTPLTGKSLPSSSLGSQGWSMLTFRSPSPFASSTSLPSWGTAPSSVSSKQRPLCMSLCIISSPYWPCLTWDCPSLPFQPC